MRLSRASGPSMLRAPTEDRSCSANIDKCTVGIVMEFAATAPWHLRKSGRDEFQRLAPVRDVRGAQQHSNVAGGLTAHGRRNRVGEVAFVEMHA